VSHSLRKYFPLDETIDKTSEGESTLILMLIYISTTGKKMFSNFAHSRTAVICHNIQR
jgi:hypothetical protein